MFLGETQKNEILERLIFIGNEINIREIIDDIKSNGILSKFITVIDSDNQSFCIKITENVYVFSQQNLLNYNPESHNSLNIESYYTTIINITDFSKDGLRDEISPYYSSYEVLKKEYPNYWKLLIAESIFKNKLEDNRK